MGSAQRATRPRWVTAIALVGALALSLGWASTTAGASERSQRTPRPAQKSAAQAFATLEIDSPTVEVRRADATAFETAEDGQRLRAGDTVRTSPTGRAQISYQDGSLTRLDVDSEYEIVRLANKKGERRTRGIQNAGQTWHRVEKVTGSGSYRVEGASTTAAVLGTAFVVSCSAPDVCTFLAVIDDITLTPTGEPATSTRSITLTPGGQVTVEDGTAGPVTTLTQDELLALQWITQNLLQDAQDGKSPGTSELGSQANPPPTRPPSSPVVTPPPPPPAGTATGGGAPPGPANRGPFAADDAYAMLEDTLLVIGPPGVLANDGDPDGDPLTAFLTSLPEHGSLSFNPNGSFVYFPDAHFHGTDAFTYVAGDGEFGSAPAAVVITVLPVNDPPVAVADAYAVREGSTLDVGAPGVLGNDSDVEGSALTAVLATGPADGTLELAADGSFSYTPDEGFTGEDSFTYRASDGSATSPPVTVTITVQENQAPVANDDAYETAENEQLVVPAPGVLTNDEDPDGDDLTAVLVEDEIGIEDYYGGEVDLAADGSFTFTPAQGFTGIFDFSYYVTDGLASSEPATVTIEVTGAEEAAPAPFPQVHEVEAGDSVPIVLQFWTLVAVDDVTIESLPTSGVLTVGETPITTAPFALGPNTVLWYHAEEPATAQEAGPLLDSFTWSATNDAGTSEPVTEYVLIGGEPIVEDTFVVSAEGEAVPVTVVVHPQGGLEFSCAIYAQPSDGDGQVSFPELQVAEAQTSFTLVYTPAESDLGNLVTFFVSACLGGAASANGATAYVAVGFQPDGPDVEVYPDTLTPTQGEDVPITVSVTEDLPLPLTISTSAQGGPGELVLDGTEGGNWFYRWVPDPNNAAPTTITFTVSNGFASTIEDVTLDYEPVAQATSDTTSSTSPSSTTSTSSTTTSTTAPTTSTSTTTTVPPTTTTTQPPAVLEEEIAPGGPGEPAE